MTPAPEREEALFEAAVRLPKSERAAFLDQHCAGEPALRQRLDALLAADDPRDGFMTVRTQEFPPARNPKWVEAPDDAIGLTIGRYKLLEKLGEGGCGVVYAAEQTAPIRRRVALKVIKLGMDTRQVVARFEAERQALAMMDHPHIAKVLDAGTIGAADAPLSSPNSALAHGRPYFVMELVRGIRITAYCDQHQLSTKQRLDLFVQVCHAIQHAHQKGIIHRDIKPSNVLVTLHDGVPAPKVIDFGIAKATEGRLTEATVYTQLHQFIGTPAYMSPEQAEMSGLDIDTRSDIYSLGVLLYELLTGKTPFDGKELMAAGLDGMRQTIREKEPARPSTRLAALPGDELTTTAKRRGSEAPKLVHLLRGDLDWIVMKCLEKDRTRRYETANGLAVDISRHLTNEPVVARPASVSYRLLKAWRRNRVLASAGIIVVSTLALGLIVSVWQATRALRAERDARRQTTVATQALASARRNAYVAEMNLAFQALGENALDRARELLNRQRPKPGQEDIRGYEWRHLWRLCQGEESFTFRDAGGDAADFSPDGRLFAYGGERIIVRDSASRKVMASIPSRAATLSFSANGKLLASSDASSVRLWDTSDWTETARSLPQMTYPALFSRDGRWFLTGMPGGFRVWDTGSWEPLGNCPGAPPVLHYAKNAVAFSPGGEYVITIAGDKTPTGDHLRLWRLPSLERVADLKAAAAEPHSVAFTREGKHVIGGLWDGQIIVWDVATGQVAALRQGHASTVTRIATASDGRTFATTGTDRSIIVWDAVTYEPVARRRGHVNDVWALAFSPDGDTLVSGSTDGLTKVWRMDSKQTDTTWREANLFAGFTGLSRSLVAFTTDSLCVWEPESGAKIRFPIPVRPAPGAGNWGHPYAVKPDDALAVRGTDEGTVEAWDLADGSKTVEWSAHDHDISSLVFAPDGKRLATGTKEGELRVWDFASRKELMRLSLPQSQVNSLAFAPDGGALAATALNFGVWVWDSNNGRPIDLEDQMGDMSSVAFSPDGKLLAATTIRFNQVILWSLPSAKRFATLKGHLGGLSSVTFSPDGNTFATGGFDRKVKLWNTRTLQELASFSLGIPIPTLNFSADGRVLVVGDLSSIGRGLQILPAPAFEEITAAEAGQ